MKQKLMKITQFQNLYFVAGSAPCTRTLRSWIASGELPGRKIGGSYFVDIEKYEASTGNKLVDRVLAKIRSENI